MKQNNKQILSVHIPKSIKNSKIFCYDATIKATLEYCYYLLKDSKEGLPYPHYCIHLPDLTLAHDSTNCTVAED